MAPNKQSNFSHKGAFHNQQQRQDAAKLSNSTTSSMTYGSNTSVRLAGLASEEDADQDADEVDNSPVDENEDIYEEEEDLEDAEEDLEDGKDVGDDDYAGILSVSEDESGDDEDEGDVLRAAEHDLIDEFERTEQRRSTASVAIDFDNMLLRDDGNWDTISGTLDSGLGGFDLNDDPFVGLASNDTLYQEMWNDAENALGSWRLPGPQAQRTNSHDSTGNKKRVRFEEETHVELRSRSSSMSSSEDPNEAFPDLFTAQDDPMLRQRFAIDIDPDATFDHEYSDTGSCYDFDGDDERLALAIDGESDSDDDDAGSISSVDNEGDTTDEETVEESLARMRTMQQARGIFRSPKLAPVTPKQARRLSQVRSQDTSRPNTPKSNKTPRQGTFALDPTRAAMSADITGKKVKLIPPTKPSEKDREFWRRAKSVVASRQTSPMSSPGLSFRSPGAAQIPARPFTAQSTLGSMFDGNLDFLRNNSDVGVGTEFLTTAVPTTMTASHPPTSFGSATMTEDSDAELEDINMQDFIDMDGYDSDSDEMHEQMMSTPSRGDSFDTIGAHNSEYGLLDHLDQQRGLVGSFRLNQNQAKHVSSLASHPAKRALTLESNALQKGRRGAANTPMTPARKKRGSQDLGLTGSGIRKAVSSPLTSRRPRSRGSSLSAAGLQQTLSPAIMQ